MRSEVYWERRYRRGGNSGAGSYGASAATKAEWLNDLIAHEQVESVVDLGCGDGGQLALLELPCDYLGIDVSATAVRWCLERWPQRQFARLDAQQEFTVRADLALSMDVMFHLVDYEDYEAHLFRLFTSSRRLVVIHSTDYDAAQSNHHVRHRRFTPDVELNFGHDWTLVERPNDPRVPGFYLYRSANFLEQGSYAAAAGAR